MKLIEAANVRSGLVLARRGQQGPGGIAYPLLTLRAIEPRGSIDLKKTDQFLAKEPLEPEYLTQENDIVIRLSQPYTAVLIAPIFCGFVVSSNFVIVRCDNNLLLPAYLAWLLNTQKVKQKIYESSSSNMLGAVKPKFFSEFDLVPLPLHEQQQIADLNALAQKEIQLLHQLADAKEKLYAQAIDQLQKSMRKAR